MRTSSSLLLSTLVLLSCGAPSVHDGGAGGGTGGGAVAPSALGDACGSGASCSSGFCVDGVCCNTSCTGQCEACAASRTGQLNGACAPLPNGGTCRASAGACDVAEVCTNGVCAADALVDAGVTCRAATGVCDLAERCDGASAACPSDVLIDAGTECHASSGSCDPAEVCTGSTGACPSDQRAASGTVCRSASGLCDVEEVCDGTATQCPTDALKSAGDTCRASTGTCDVAESCSGSSAACPVDGFAPNTSALCAPYKCTGTTAACTTTCANTNADCANEPRTFCNVSTCERGRLVFATSTTYNSNFGVGTVGGGVVRADNDCQALANDAGLGGTFRAWLSDPTSFPASRFVRDGGVYVRAGDRAIIARDWADLTDGTIGALINRSERGITVNFANSGVLTGTTIVGTSATFSGGNTNTHCVGWASSSGQNFGTRGDGFSLTSAWTNASNPGCGTLTGARLYCFEQ